MRSAVSVFPRIGDCVTHSVVINELRIRSIGPFRKVIGMSRNRSIDIAPGFPRNLIGVIIRAVSNGRFFDAPIVPIVTFGRLPVIIDSSPRSDPKRKLRFPNPLKAMPETNWLRHLSDRKDGCPPRKCKAVPASSLREKTKWGRDGLP